MKIKVLYEDSNILAIDKPSGISVHGDGKTKEKTITDWVLKNYPKMKNVGESMGEIKRPGIVHRLDRETSGVMLLAKTQKAFDFLKSQFVNREIKKTYYAIVSGSVKNDRGIINKPIGRSPRDFRRYLSGRGARGEMREAITEYKVLKRFEAKTENEQFFYARGSHPVLGEGRSAKKNVHSRSAKFTYLEVKPKTGRTHQIRVHMKFLNHPVVGDTLYNPSGPLPNLPLKKGEEKGGGRMFLHAKSIEFKNLKGETLKIESPLPKEFTKVLK